MFLADRITRLPRAYDPARGAEAAFGTGAVRDLLTGAAGSSPYLHGLILRERDWLDRIDTPEAALRDVLEALPQTPDPDLPAALRRAKGRVALLTALCDLGGIWSLEEVTGALTALADIATDLAVAREVRAEVSRGRLAAEDCGLFVLAMGKMGAFELNYSSDIDLIVLFDGERHDDIAATRGVLVRAVRRAMAVLSETRADGYVFRTDLRLRPDPGVTPIVLSAQGAERYYEQLGRTWERAAHIKARPCAGDLAAGAAYLERLRPFVWRRHLDFAAIRDAHDMRLRIRDHKGLGGPISLMSHDMKLGRGGIREIEFFTQTRQIIAGGRDPSLRVRGTVQGLARLAEAGWIGAQDATLLTAAYRAHREVEHRLQMIADRQTHALPDSAEGMVRLAALMGQDVDGLKVHIRARLEAVEALTEGFFGGGQGSGPMPVLSVAQAAIVDAWRAMPALRSTRALDIFDRIRPGLLRALLATPQADLALAQFDAFLSRLPAGVQLFSLFEANPLLIDLIVDIAGTTPDLATYLGANASVLDAVIGGDFFAPLPGVAVLEASLSTRMARAPDYEARLDEARRWTRERHFRIGVQHLRGLIDTGAAGADYASLARAVVRAVWPVVAEAFARSHGTAPGRGAMVLGMGSLGAGRLNARSDLDLIVIYDAAGVEASQGRRPLPAQTYYTRLTQSLATALSAPMAGGQLYQVDMRLRPSGRQGPVATSLGAFAHYQRHEAWTWEHLALTRADPVAGAPDLCADVAAIRAEVLAMPRDRAAVLADAAAMRARLLAAHGTPGRLQDVELAATLLSLLAQSDARDVATQIAAGADRIDAAALTEAWRFLAGLRSVERFLGPGPLDPAQLGAAAWQMLTRATGATEPADLASRLAHHASVADAIITRLLAGGFDAPR